MLSTVGLCDETTAIVGAGHDVQVVDVDVTVEDYDTAIDYIVTPTRLIETRHEYPECGSIFRRFRSFGARCTASEYRKKPA